MKLPARSVSARARARARAHSRYIKYLSNNPAGPLPSPPPAPDGPRARVARRISAVIRVRRRVSASAISQARLRSVFLFHRREPTPAFGGEAATWGQTMLRGTAMIHSFVEGNRETKERDAASRLHGWIEGEGGGEAWGNLMRREIKGSFGVSAFRIVACDRSMRAFSFEGGGVMRLRNYRGVTVVLLPFSVCSVCAGRAGRVPSRRNPSQEISFRIRAGRISK